MHPDLFSLGPLTIRSYGTMMVLGFFLAILLARFRVHRYDIKWDQFMDIAFYLLIGGIVGAKLLYWAIFPQYLKQDASLIVHSPFVFFQHLGSGFVFFGSVVGGAAALVWFARRNHLRIISLLDLTAPCLAVGHAVGRIGCFLAGCCYGKACSCSWSVTFTDPKSLAPLNVPLHPTQLYESGFLFFLTIILVGMEKFIQPRPGRIFSMYVFSYSLWRFFIEFLRNDPRGQFLHTGLSSTQAIAIATFFISLVLFFILPKVGSSHTD